ncbi:MAG: hypothetical protein Q9183_001510 [Haloplaca sp. 2 TL-2023]
MVGPLVWLVVEEVLDLDVVDELVVEAVDALEVVLVKEDEEVDDGDEMDDEDEEEEDEEEEVVAVELVDVVEVVTPAEVDDELVDLVEETELEDGVAVPFLYILRRFGPPQIATSNQSGAGLDRVTTVAFSRVFDAKVGVCRASGGARINRYFVATDGVLKIGQCTTARALAVAAQVAIADDEVVDDLDDDPEDDVDEETVLEAEVLDVEEEEEEGEFL